MSIVHAEIKEKLNNFICSQKIPNLLFYGNMGSGKTTLLNEFISNLYKGEADVNSVMYVNCSHGKGIKFIRNELKFFAKTNMPRKANSLVDFKSIILMNADNLTIDAQSALRRIIELYSQSTRFFMIAENKNKFMKPILSRLCEIHVCNHHHQKIVHDTSISSSQQRLLWLKKDILALVKDEEIKHVPLLQKKSILYYERGYSANDLLQLIETYHVFEKLQLSPQRIFDILIEYNNMRKEVRSEMILILKILSSVFIYS
jgi:DNA polymerase III delta prime subunit